MTLLDNITRLLGDDLKRTVTPGAKLKIAASCFSIYAYEALKAELEQIESLEFIFTSPTFLPNDVADKLRKEHREFHIPKIERERSLYGSEFEVRLRNELTQKAVARECADWMRRKAVFRSNTGRAPMQQFACVSAGETQAAYMPLHGFTAVDLGYEKGNAVSNFVNKFDEPKRLLDLARAACKDKEAPIPAAYQPFNKATKDGRKMEAYSGLLSAAIRSMIDLKAGKDIESLFTGGRTSALLDTITGIEDFELIAFIVVQEVAS